MCYCFCNIFKYALNHDVADSLFTPVSTVIIKICLQDINIPLMVVLDTYVVHMNTLPLTYYLQQMSHTELQTLAAVFRWQRPHTILNSFVYAAVLLS